MAVIGEQFGSLGSEICGIVVSVRYHEDILSLWTRTGTFYFQNCRNENEKNEKKKKINKLQEFKN